MNMASIYKDGTSGPTDELVLGANIRNTTVDSIEKLISLLDKFASVPLEPDPLQQPDLYFSTQDNPDRTQSSISAMALFCLPQQSIYFVNVPLLGSAAFSTKNSKGCSLKGVLESPELPKVCFDVRNPSQSLSNPYGVSLAGVQDLQMMALIARPPGGILSNPHLPSLAQCVEKDLPKTSALRENRYGVSPSPQAWHSRALVVMAELWKVYSADVCKSTDSWFWRPLIRHITEERIELWKKGPPHDKEDKSRGPWSDKRVECKRDQWK